MFVPTPEHNFTCGQARSADANASTTPSNKSFGRELIMWESPGTRAQECFQPRLVLTLVNFVRSIGIEVQACPITWKTQFPGLDIRAGVVLIDEDQLIHPGNILHEAGHIAVHDPVNRRRPKFSPSKGEELSALAWSYAATVHLGLSSELVFYPGSYQGWDTALVENFAAGRYIGVPLLQRYGMAIEPRFAHERKLKPYPHMLRWVR
jgi:hypothetical protein